MASDRQSGGHYFDFSTELCVKCGMNREHYEDNGKPRCAGKMPGSRTPVAVRED
jgi:hypothetical protein